MSDSACSDSAFCNGAERCAVTNPAADARGCVAALRGPCLGSQQCDEQASACLSDCTSDPDADHDGYKATNCAGTDCDDADADRFPGNAEVCDPAGHDEDCDSTTLAGPEGDADGDGYVSDHCCNGPRCGNDCNDNGMGASYTHPDAGELCDDLDNDCDGKVDESPKDFAWYPDRDGDAYGDGSAEPTLSCGQVKGRVLDNGDCDDTKASVNPGNPEVCGDGIDNDCKNGSDDGLSCPCKCQLPNASIRCIDPTVCSIATCNDGFADCDNRQNNGCEIDLRAPTSCGRCSKVCDANARCVATGGGYDCTCGSGYAGVGTSCADVDECTQDPSRCGHGGSCSNAVGGYTCSGCAAGFESSEGMFPTCVDIDECATNNGGCGDATYYSCTNNTGAAPTCADIDECSGANVCTADYRCVNLAPCYFCVGQFADWTPMDSPATFTINGNGTVTDSSSALVWQQGVDASSYTWANAKIYCAGLSLTGTGWRLPTTAELLSIVDFGRSNPAIDPTAFPGAPADYFWSSSAYVGSSGSVWVVDFTGGSSYFYGTSGTGRVRCVR